MSKLKENNYIFVLLNGHHSRAVLSIFKTILNNKNNKFNLIFIGGNKEYEFLESDDYFKWNKMFINFEELNSPKEFIDIEKNKTTNYLNGFSTNIYFNLRKFLKNKLKGTSIKSLIVQFLIYVRLKKKLKLTIKLFKKYKPFMVIKCSDRDHSDPEAVFSKGAKIFKLPIILLNLNIFSKEVACEYRIDKDSNNVLPELDIFKNKNLYDKWSLYFLKTCIFNNILFQSREHLLAHKMFGTLSNFPWFNGNGLNDLILVNNGFDKIDLIDNKVEEKKILIIGHPEYELIYKNFLKKEKLKSKIYQENQFDNNKKLIIAAIPQWFEQGLLNIEEHNKEIKNYLEILSRTECNILLSLHPRQQLKDYLDLEDKYIKISKTKLSNILCCADRYVTNLSSTIIWGILLGIPTVTYDPCKLKYKNLLKFKSIKICESKSQFSSNILNFKLDKKLLKNDWNLLKRDEVFNDKLSQKYIDLFSKYL